MSSSSNSVRPPQTATVLAEKVLQAPNANPKPTITAAPYPTPSTADPQQPRTNSPVTYRKNSPKMKIQNGQPPPSIAATLNGKTIDIATEPVGAWTAIIFYRGHW